MSNEPKPGTTRRDMLRRGAVVGGVAWTTPMVSAVPAFAQSLGSPAPPVCTPAGVMPLRVNIVDLPDPNGSYQQGAQEDPLVQIAREQVVVVNDLLVDISVPGGYSGGTTPLTPALLSGEVISLMLHFDPPGTPSPTGAPTATLTVDPDYEIVGLILTNETNLPITGGGPRLDQTDSVFGVGGPYDTGIAQRRSAYTATGGSDGGDVVALSADRQSLTVDLVAGTNFIDEIRVLVACDGTTTISPTM